MQWISVTQRLLQSLADGLCPSAHTCLLEKLSRRHGHSRWGLFCPLPRGMPFVATSGKLSEDQISAGPGVQDEMEVCYLSLDHPCRRCLSKAGARHRDFQAQSSSNALQRLKNLVPRGWISFHRNEM